MKKVILFVMCLLLKYTIHAMEQPIHQKELNHALTIAIQQDKPNEIFELILAGAQDDGNHHLLHYCIHAGHTVAAKALLKRGAKVNERDFKGETPLIIAAKGPKMREISLLLEHHARIDITDNYADNVFHHLAMLAGRLQRFIDIEKATPSLTLNNNLAKYRARKGIVENECIELIHYQQDINNILMVQLLCFYRLKKENHPVGKLLYNQRKTLLLPHIDAHRYVSLYRLLTMKDNEGSTPYDYCRIKCLNPRRFAKKSGCLIQ